MHKMMKRLKDYTTSGRMLQVHQPSSICVTLFLCLSLTACAWPWKKMDSVQNLNEKKLPPSALLEDCVKPSDKNVLKTHEQYAKSPVTMLDIYILLIKQDTVIDDCNVDKGALREWRKSVDKQDVK